MDAMDNLRKEGVLFGFSATQTRENTDIITSFDFIDMLIEKGVYIGWYFQFLPIGKDPDVNLMATPQQRIKLRKFIEEVRATRPIFIGDFWNDGPFVGGCIAGGRRYIHINHKGDVEPCAFVHFAVDNIKNKSLIEALQSPFSNF
jgi:MoaA/NifB/PqqE/SkfB family radical SAM enzyme